MRLGISPLFSARPSLSLLLYSSASLFTIYHDLHNPKITINENICIIIQKKLHNVSSMNTCTFGTLGKLCCQYFCA